MHIGISKIKTSFFTCVQKTKNIPGIIRPVELLRLLFLAGGILLLAWGFLIRTDNVPLVGSSLSETGSVSFLYDPVKADLSFGHFADYPKLNRDIPRRIIIPSVGIDIAIKKSPLIKGYWQVFDDAAGWGETSASPEEKGNQVVFAHARAGLFLPLRGVKNGQRVYILTENKYYGYEIETIKEVKPTDVEVIKQTSDAILTLYTCSGFADSKRLIVKAKRV